MKNKDILIIGGGASGLMAAITAARADSGLSVTVLEGGARVGKKLITTGNGRCNITNQSLTSDRFHSSEPTATMSIIERFDLAATSDFFMSLGIPLCTLEDGKMYPCSLQASSVVDALRFECERLGVEIITDSRVISVDAEGTVKTAVEQYSAKAVIIACGGKAASSTGSDGSGFDLLKSLGHSVKRTYPPIVPIKTDTQLIRAAKGIKVECAVTATVGNETKTERGEVLFTEYGLSGPPILQLSGFIAQRSPAPAKITLDMLPDRSRDWLFGYLMRRSGKAYGDTAENLFLGLLNKRVGISVIKYCSLGVNDSCSAFSKREIAALTDAVKGFTLNVTGLCGYEAAQTTGGGVPLCEFDSELRSLKADRVLACGEVLDVYGDCGGFNLQWAWSSGHIAGENAALIARQTR